jgi:hypothetical protein
MFGSHDSSPCQWMPFRFARAALGTLALKVIPLLFWC